MGELQTCMLKDGKKANENSENLNFVFQVWENYNLVC